MERLEIVRSYRFRASLVFLFGTKRACAKYEARGYDMTTVRKTPRQQPDGRLSNVVLEGGRSKKYVTRDAHGRYVVVAEADSKNETENNEQPVNGAAERSSRE